MTTIKKSLVYLPLLLVIPTAYYGGKKIIKIQRIKNLNNQNLKNANNQLSYLRNQNTHINILESNLNILKRESISSSSQIQQQENIINELKTRYNTHSTTSFFDGKGVLQNNLDIIPNYTKYKY